VAAVKANIELPPGVTFTGDQRALTWGERPMVPTTVCIPTHPARGAANDPASLLGQAVASVEAQEWMPAGGWVIACDLNGDGAAATRQRALDLVHTEFVSFLDSDDRLYPRHLRAHFELLSLVGNGGPPLWADVAYSWFDGVNPFPQHRGRQLDPADPHHTTMTITVRTELAKRIGMRANPDANREWAGEDWLFIKSLADAGARFVGTGEITWHYRGHGGNTSGHPWLGDGPAVAPVRPVSPP
jgi:hypothetical protein